jgi:hypothetical protein
MKMMKLIQINIINHNLSKNIQNIKILKNNNLLVLKIQVFFLINYINKFIGVNNIVFGYEKKSD